MTRWPNPKSVYISDPEVCGRLRALAARTGMGLTATLEDMVDERFNRLRAETPAHQTGDTAAR